MFVCVAGKNNIAVNVLEYLIKNCNDRYELGVVCNLNEDGINTWQKSFRYFAQRYGIKEYSLKDMYEKKDLVFLSMEFDQIIKPERFADARLYNIHFSLLPQYKGMFTSAIPILNGESQVGVTFHKIDQGIDTGDIIAQRPFELKKEYTSRDLYTQYINNGTRLVLEHIEDVLQNRVHAYPQPTENSTYYSRFYIDYSNIQIDLKQTADSICRQIRAFSFREYQLPIVNGNKIIAAKETQVKSKKKPGTILVEDKTGMMISTIDYNCCLYYDRFDELLEACKTGDLSKVMEICNVREHINAANSTGWTPLIVATYHNQIDIVKYLILMGADIHAVNNNGTTLLMYAKNAYGATGDITLFQLFYELGLDPEAKDYAGKALHEYIVDEKEKYEAIFDMIG